MAHYTLQFPDYATAQAAAQALGFWEPTTYIYDEQPDGELAPIGIQLEGRLKTQGQSTHPDGTVCGWAIDDIGLDPVITPGEYDEEGVEITPPTTLPGYFVNVTGELPEPAMAYLAPGGYGCAGRLFAGTTPASHS
jgi:hypothetical protein